MHESFREPDAATGQEPSSPHCCHAMRHPRGRIFFAFVRLAEGNCYAASARTNPCQELFEAESFAGAMFGPGQPLDALHHFLLFPGSLGRFARPDKDRNFIAFDDQAGAKRTIAIVREMESNPAGTAGAVQEPMICRNACVLFRMRRSRSS